MQKNQISHTNFVDEDVETCSVDNHQASQPKYFLQEQRYYT